VVNSIRDAIQIQLLHEEKENDVGKNKIVFFFEPADKQYTFSFKVQNK